MVKGHIQAYSFFLRCSEMDTVSSFSDFIQEISKHERSMDVQTLLSPYK